jgi:hypothetical protein
MKIEAMIINQELFHAKLEISCNIELSKHANMSPKLKVNCFFVILKR